MPKQRYRQYKFVMVLALVVSMGLVGTAAATQTSTSTNYSVTETEFGTGSAQHVCSGGTYCAQVSAGDTTVGRGSSANFSAQFGSDTTDIPLLEVIVAGGNQDVGVLDDTHTGSAVSTVSVRDYLSNGYVMQVTGAPPSQGVHNLTALATPSTSQQGSEQFGINFANNTAPNIGADPVQVPSGSTFGVVGSDYGTADLFKYVDGDVVAQSTVSNGETDYTLSMIINVSKVTPGGQYTGQYSVVVVPMY
jgi:hypothetical protein